MKGFYQTIWNAVPDYMFTTDPFIPGEIEELLENGEFNQDIEVIAGTNWDEGILYFLSEIADPSKWENWKEDFDTRGPQTLFNIGNASEITAKDLENAYKILEFYERVSQSYLCQEQWFVDQLLWDVWYQKYNRWVR